MPIFIKNYTFTIIIVLAVILAILSHLYDKLNADNKRLEAELTGAITLNIEQTKTIENLLNEHEKQLKAINSANAEKSKLNKNLKELKNEIKEHSGDAISVFNYTIDRLWDDQNTTKN